MQAAFSKLIIENKALNDPLTVRIRSELNGTGIEVVEDACDAARSGAGNGGSLVLMHHRGRFVKEFPVPEDSPSCGEKYIITMLNCPFSCTYCFLQSYLGQRQITVFTNTEKLKYEITDTLGRERHVRLTVGELGDGLAIDRLTRTVEELLPLFAGTGTLLEIRTKSAEVDHILYSIAGEGSTLQAGNEPARRAGPARDANQKRSADLRENLLLTWTLGPEGMIRNEERGTAPLEDRLDAIRRVLAAGIKVGIRFDPVIPFYAEPGRYDLLIRKIHEASEGKKLHRFELGALRFPPGLLELVRRKNPRSRLLQGEFVRDHRGRARLYRPGRVELYGEIARSIRSRFTGVPIELCMETGSVWEDAGL